MIKSYIFLFLLSISINNLAYPQLYSPSSAVFQKYEIGGIEVADLDNDLDLDIIMTGTTTEGEARTVVYKNESGTFLEVVTNLPNLRNADVACGDYNDDGLYDVLISGFDLSGNYTKLFTNTGDFVFSESTSNAFMGLFNSTISWVDYDADTDMDFLLTGTNGQMEEFSILYENIDGSIFNVSSSFLINGLTQASLDWADFDNDGDLDLAALGLTGGDVENTTDIYINNGDKTFTKSNLNFPQLMNGTIRFGDIDNDLDQDIIMTGNTFSNSHLSKIFFNESGTFIESSLDLEGVAQNFRSGTTLLDYDTDGDLDVLLSGRASGVNGESVLTLLNNNNLSLSTISNIGIPEFISKEVYPGDFDNDGDTDLFMVDDGYSGPENLLFLNNSLSGNYQTNTKPIPPSSFSRKVRGNENTFSWNTGSDDITRIEELTYNYYVGTQTTKDDIVPAHSNLSNGKRKLPKRGKNRLRSVVQKALPEGFIYWAVQSVDGNYIGSTFSDEQTFYFILAPSLVSGSIQHDPLAINLSWLDNSNVENKYHIERSDNDVNYQQIFEGPANTTSFNDLTANELEVLYSYRVFVSNDQGISGYDSISIAIPTPPSNFRIDKYSYSDDYISLQWNDESIFETGYAIERSYLDANSFDQIYLSAKNTEVYSDSYQAGEGYYYYRSCAVNEFGSGPYSDTINIINIFSPSNLSGAALNGPIGLHFKWNDNSSIEDSYELHKSVDGSEFELIATLPENSNSFEDIENITFETNYQYLVKCLLDGFSSEYDSIELLIPAPPTNLQASDLQSQVLIEWDDQSDHEIEFIVECSENNLDNFVEIGRVTKNTENYLDQRLLNKGEFYYRLQAISENGVGIYSDTLFFSFMTKPEITKARIFQDSLFIEILWNDNSTYEDHYKITRYDNQADISKEEIIAQNMEIFEDPSVSIETEYIYILQSFNEFAISPADSITVAIPQAPTELSSSNANDAIQLTWIDNSAVEETYLIERADDNFEFYEIFMADADIENHEDKNVLDGSTYHYRVVPANKSGKGFSSDTTSFAYLNAPADTEGKYNSDQNSIEISWKDISDHETGYIIERKSENDAGYIVLDTLPANSEHYLDNQLLDFDNFNYRISAFNENGNSDSRFITIGIITALYDDELDQLKLYPIPSISILYIDIPIHIEQHGSYHIYNETGILIKKSNIKYNSSNRDRISINVSDLKKGLYLIKLTNHEKIYKFIKK